MEKFGTSLKQAMAQKGIKDSQHRFMTKNGKNLWSYSPGQIISHEGQEFIFLEALFASIHGEVRTMLMDGSKQHILLAKDISIVEEKCLPTIERKTPNGWTLKYFEIPESTTENNVFAISTQRFDKNSLDFIGGDSEFYSIMKPMQLEPEANNDEDALKM